MSELCRERMMICRVGADISPRASWLHASEPDSPPVASCPRRRRFQSAKQCDPPATYRKFEGGDGTVKGTVFAAVLEKADTPAALEAFTR